MLLRRKFLLTTFKITDLVILGLALGMTTWLLNAGKGNISLSQFMAVRIKVENIIIVCGFVLSWFLIFTNFGLYQSKRLTTLKAECIDILKATSLGTLFLATCGILFKVGLITQPFLIVFWVASSSLTIGSRLFLRPILKKVRGHGRNLRHVLIVGTNPRMVKFAQKIQACPELGYRIIGFVDEEWPGLKEFGKSGFPKITDFENFSTFLRSTIVVDEVIIGLPIKSLYQQAAKIIEQCEEQGVHILHTGDLFTPTLARGHMDAIEEPLLMTLQPGAIGHQALIFKRVIDILLSLPLLIIFIPVFLTVALAVKLSSPGPTFFLQTRIGLNKRKFRLIKFRTMVPDAENMQADLEHMNEVNGAAFKIQNDPRLTRIGQFLRSTSLDELPQLFNVLKGDLSLVGPRPLPVRDYEEFNQDWHRRRFSVFPGITCLWQVSGRSKLSFDKWMELDMQYIDHWSPWLDIKILFKTIPVVLRRIGAV